MGVGREIPTMGEKGKKREDPKRTTSFRFDTRTVPTTTTSFVSFFVCPPRRRVERHGARDGRRIRPREKDGRTRAKRGGTVRKTSTRAWNGARTEPNGGSEEKLTWNGRRAGQEAIRKQHGGEEKRAKGEMMRALHETQQVLVRTTILHHWCRKTKPCLMGHQAVEEAARWESGCQEAADRLFAMHQQLLCVGTPALNVRNAVRVLRSGECDILPRGMHVRPPPKTPNPKQAKERKAVVQELEYRMIKAILRERATEHLRLKDVRDGTAVLEVLGQFQVQLTLCTSPFPSKWFHWKVIRVEHTGSLSLPQDEGETLSMLGFEVEQRMNANHAPLLAMCAVLGDLTAMLTLQSVKQYGQRTKQGKGSQHVHVALEAQPETHATEAVCFHLWTCQRDKRRILRLWATPTGNIAGVLRLDPIAGEGPSCTLDVPPDRGTAREALSWALDACDEDLLESLDARLRPRGAPRPVGEEDHALFARGSSPRRCRSAGGAREASLVLALSTHGRLHVRVERLTGKLIVEGKEGPSANLASKLQRLLQKERNTELSSVQIDAAIRALFLEAGLERLKQTFQLHGLSPAEGPATPQRAELERASTVYYRLPGWGSSRAPVLLQATLDPWGHPMPEEFALHLPSGAKENAPGSRADRYRREKVALGPDMQWERNKKRKACAGGEGERPPLMHLVRRVLHAAHVLLHRMAVESAIYSDEHHDCSNSSNRAGPIQANVDPARSTPLRCGAPRLCMMYGGPCTSAFLVETELRSVPMARSSQDVLRSLLPRALFWAEQDGERWRFCLGHDVKSGEHTLSLLCQQLFGVLAWTVLTTRSSPKPEPGTIGRKHSVSSLEMNDMFPAGLPGQECSRPVPLPCCSLYPDGILTLPCLESLFARGQWTAVASALRTTMHALTLLRAHFASGDGQALAHRIVLLPKTCHRVQIFVHPFRALDILILSKDCIWVGVREISFGAAAKPHIEEGPFLDDVLQESGKRHGLECAKLEEHGVHSDGFLLETRQLGVFVHEVLSGAVAGRVKQEQ